MQTALFAAAGLLASAALRARAAARAPASAPREGVLVGDAARLAAKRAKFLRDGPWRLQVVADFDRTITTAFLPSGEQGESSHGMVEKCRHLSAAYRAATRACHEHYYPIETSPNLTLEQKLPLMVEWYSKVHELVVSEGFQRPFLRDAVLDARAQLRPGADALLRLCADHAVPFLIFSAGLADVIVEFMAHRCGPLPPNAHVVANRMLWAEDGRLVGFAEPLIHMFNKNDSHTRDTPWFDEVRERDNVLLLGDSLGDVTMAHEGGDDHHTVLRVGFLNERDDDKRAKLLPKYLAAFDLLVLGDGPMDHALHLVQDVCSAHANPAQ